MACYWSARISKCLASNARHFPISRRPQSPALSQRSTGSDDKRRQRHTPGATTRNTQRDLSFTTPLCTLFLYPFAPHISLVSVVFHFKRLPSRLTRTMGPPQVPLTQLAPVVIGVMWMETFLAGIFVCLRIWTRSAIGQAGIGWDDAFMGATWVRRSSMTPPIS